jgi:hypothetical protein
MKLMDGSQARSWVGVIQPFRSVVKPHASAGVLSVGGINDAIRRLEGERYPWR